MTRLSLALLALLPTAAAAAQDFPPPPPPAEQQKCGQRQAMIYRLANQWLETQIALWVSPNGAMMEVWGNPKTGTNTILMTVPGGETCMVDTGLGFQMFPYAPGEDL